MNKHSTVGGVLIDRLITSDDDLEYTFEFILNNDIESIEVVFTYEYYNTIANNEKNQTRFTETLKSKKIKCQYLQTMGLNIVLLGVIVSIIFFEITDISPGGIIVPGLMVLYIQEPERMVYTVIVAVITYYVVKFL